MTARVLHGWISDLHVLLPFDDCHPELELKAGERGPFDASKPPWT